MAKFCPIWSHWSEINWTESKDCCHIVLLTKHQVGQMSVGQMSFGQKPGHRMFWLSELILFVQKWNGGPLISIKDQTYKDFLGSGNLTIHCTTKFWNKMFNINLRYNIKHLFHGTILNIYSTVKYWTFIPQYNIKHLLHGTILNIYYLCTILKIYSTVQY